MLRAILVAPETRRALRRRRDVVARVAACAIGVSLHAMKSSELCAVVTSCASRRLRDPFWAVRAVTLIAAAPRELSMGGGGFVRVTRRASAPRQRTAVLFVAVGARAMPCRRAAVLLGVAALTTLAECAAVRFVAARALAVAGRGRRVNGRVTALATGLKARRPMWQAAVTAFTRSVAG